MTLSIYQKKSPEKQFNVKTAKQPIIQFVIYIYVQRPLRKEKKKNTIN